VELFIFIYEKKTVEIIPL